MKEINAKNVANWYMKGFWSAEMVADAATKGKITAAEKEKILKLPVKNQSTLSGVIPRLFII